MKWIMVFYIFLITVITAIADSFIKRSGQVKNGQNQLVIGLVMYVVLGIIWFFVYKQAKFSIAGSVYGVTTALIFAIVGIFYFKESLRPQEIIGIILAIASIFLLGRFEN